MPFPAFSDYQDTFSTSLLPTTFATFSLPPWLPLSNQLVRIARVIYPHWKERRLERGGHRIIPTLNVSVQNLRFDPILTLLSCQFDETDTSNESYVCFRRREIKAVRKTRASQVTFSDKLLRLQAELAVSLELAQCVLSRENVKKEVARQTENVWERRLAILELKRKFPALGDKADEELLQDKERVPKIPKTDGLSYVSSDTLNLRLILDLLLL
jgi:enhancer of polycomb-like protein